LPGRPRRCQDAIGGDELEAGITEPRQQPIQGGLIYGSEGEQRVAVRQQPELSAAKEASASLVEVASDPDLVAVHGPDDRDRAARSRLAKGRSFDARFAFRKEGPRGRRPRVPQPLDEADLLGAQERLGAARRTELGQDMADVPLGGAQRDRQSGRDFCIARALRH